MGTETTPTAPKKQDVPNPLGVLWEHPASGVVRIKDHELAMVEEYMPDGVTKRKKVAIVGFAASSCLDAPFNDPTYSIWGMNQLYRHIPRADRMFEIHENYYEYVVEGTDHCGWLRTAQIPVYMTRHWPEFPSSVRFPLEKMVKKFGKYFTSSIAYMLALAIVEGFEQIDLYGVDLSVGTEYFHQRPCVEMLIGYANASGIMVGIPTASALLKSTHLYGYDKESTALGLVREEDYQIRRAKLLKLRDKAITELNQLDGALAEIDYMLKGMELRAHNAQWNP